MSTSLPRWTAVVMLLLALPVAMLITGNSRGPTLPGAEQPTEIPVDLRGRWGLTPADCHPLRTDFPAGLMEVSADVLTFHQMRGKMGAVIGGSVEDIRARFEFAGEGVEGSRVVALALKSGGQRLERSEYGDGTGETLLYSRCP